MKLSTHEALAELAPILTSGKLLLFAGSGISVDPPANMPTWDGLMDNFINYCEQIQPLLPPDKQFLSIIHDARLRKDRYPIQVADVLKNELIRIDNDVKRFKFKENFSTWFSQIFSKGEPNNNHNYIVQTNYPFILTSNYDTLLEKAAINYNFQKLSLTSYSFKDNVELIASSIYNKYPCIIHIHGDIKGIMLDDFVFTAKEYTAFKQKYPGFTLVLQSLFLNYSVLFIGYGASDPHLEDISEEMSFFLNFVNCDNGLPGIYMVLHEDKIDEVLDRYKNLRRTKIIAVNNFSDSTTLLSDLMNIFPRPPDPVYAP